MTWQEIIFTAGGWYFAACLVPTILQKGGKPSIATSLPTGLFLYLYALALFSYDLVSSAVSTGIAATFWLILAWQRWRRNRKPATRYNFNSIEF